MDSAVTAATAARDHELAFLHANYGQRTEGKELACFHALADHYEARKRLVVEFPVFAAIGGSSLTDRGIPVREGEPEKGRIPTSYVPFRNAHLLAAATSWGEILGARAIFVGAVWEDSSGYPDCRPAFYRAFEEAIRQGTRPETEIRIETPVIRHVQGRHRAGGKGARACRSTRPGPATRRRTAPAGPASPAVCGSEGIRGSGSRGPLGLVGAGA